MKRNEEIKNEQSSNSTSLPSTSTTTLSVRVSVKGNPLPPQPANYLSDLTLLIISIGLADPSFRIFVQTRFFSSTRGSSIPLIRQLSTGEMIPRISRDVFLFPIDRIFLRSISPVRDLLLLSRSSGYHFFLFFSPKRFDLNTGGEEARLV